MPKKTGNNPKAGNIAKIKYYFPSTIPSSSDLPKKE